MPTGASALLDMQFSWTGTAGNNGLLQGHKVITGPQSGATSALSVSQTFSYDNVNRITSFSDNGSGSALSRNFSYTGNSDGGQLGNVYVSGNDAGLPLLSTVSVTSSANIDATTNRLKTAGSQAYAYDANGNLTSIDPAGSATYTFTYDAENRQITRHDAGGVTTQFTYDGLGQRVQIAAGGASPTTYVYDAFGRMVADYGSPVASPPCTTCYLSVDHLGSTRMVTDQYGNAVARHDYAPFGDELVGGAGRGSLWGASDSVRQKFTGVEQDNGDINFNQARYYLLPQGRFNSPDPVNFGADILNPQSWNGYSYVLNSPLSGVDPNGLQSISSSGGGASSVGDGGSSGGAISFSFSWWGGSGPSGTKTSSASDVGVTISAAPRLLMGGPMDVPIGAAKKVALRLMRLAPQDDPATVWVMSHLQPATIKQKSGGSAVSYLAALLPFLDGVGEVAEGANIALGWRAGGLRSFAREVGADHLLNVPEGQWKQVFLSHVKNPSTRFHVSMTGFSGGTPQEMILNEIQLGTNTGWELEQLQKAGRLPQVNFYEPGRSAPIPNPFVK